MVIVAGKREDGLPGGPKLPPAGHRATSSPPPPHPPRTRLHNFTFPTSSWGAHRILRCSNLPFGVDSDAAASVAHAADRSDRAARKNPPSPEKPLLRLSTAVRDSKVAEGGGRKDAEGGRTFSPAAAAAAGAGRPWNLRTRRAACNAPAENGVYRHPISATESPPRLAAEKACPATEKVKGRSDGFEKGERQKFSISLSRYEIERDFSEMKGTKPSRRPKKRPRIVQRQLDLLFPGLCLSEVAPETYKIDE